MIRGFVGGNGSGKTLCCVARHIAPALDQGRRVFANIRIDHPGAELLRTPAQFRDLRECLVLIDEVSAVFPSRGFQGLPLELARMLQQLRKVDVEVLWTAPAWSRAEVILREATQRVTVCRGSFPVKGPERWPHNRLFNWVTYDAVDYESFTLQTAKTKKLRPIDRTYYWRPRHEHQNLYDTREAVELFAHLDVSGVCIDCGKSRTRPKCECSTQGAPAPGVERKGSRVPVLPASVDLLPSRVR